MLRRPENVESSNFVDHTGAVGSEERTAGDEVM
jgi:hypothetical protein